MSHERGSVVVSGASTGIGEACVHHLTAQGFRVFAGVRKPSDAENFSDPLFLDVIDSASIAQAARSVEEAVGEGGLAGLVNNAGITVPGPLEFLPIEDLRRQLEVNVIGQVAVTQAFLPLLRRRRGRIVNMGSISGKIASPMLGAYAMSKFAIEAFSDSLRRELAPWNLHVSLIEPGTIATPIWAKGLAWAEELAWRLPESAVRLYGPMMESAREAATRISRSGLSPGVVARAVHHALTAEPPRTRYLVGDARLAARLAWLLPDRWIDALAGKRLGLRRPAGES